MLIIRPLFMYIFVNYYFNLSGTLFGQDLNALIYLSANDFVVVKITVYQLMFLWVKLFWKMFASWGSYIELLFKNEI